MKYSKTFFIALLLAFSPTQVIAAENIESAISEREQEINSWLTSQEDNMLNLLERITNINSGFSDIYFTGKFAMHGVILKQPPVSFDTAEIVKSDKLDVFAL